MITFVTHFVTIESQFVTPFLSAEEEGRDPPVAQTAAGTSVHNALKTITGALDAGA